MKIIINQYFGLGDIIFCMTIARRWIKEGHEIYWPVLPQFVEGLQRAYPDVNFVNWKYWKIDYERRNEHDILIDGKEYRVIPLRWNVEIMNVPYDRCMETKYGLLGMDYKEWKEKASWDRNIERENELKDLLYIDPHEPYILVNEKFQSDSKGIKNIRTKVSKESEGIFNIVNMHTVEGFSLFDWASILENAKEIHTVSTSILYLLELLDINCPIHLYERPTDPGFKQVNYLFTKPYILHT